MSATQEGVMGLYYGWDSGESGWKNQVDANWLKIGALMQIAAISRSLTAPPGSPANGDTYIVASGATGAWSGRANQIAVWRSTSSAWEFYVPKLAWIAGISSENAAVIYTSTGWSVFGGSGGATWGSITGTLSAQTDLQAALDAKANVSSLGTIASQNANAVAITGGSINGTPIGATTRAAGNFNDIDANGNVTLTGVARRILADFSNSTLSNRTFFETSTVNSPTSFGIKPNGTGASSHFAALNSPDAGNAGRIRLSVDATSAGLVCDSSGSGSNLPLSVIVGGSEQIKVTTAGNTGFGVSNPTSHKVEVSGRAYASGGFVFPTFLKTTVPAASANTNASVIVTDASTGRGIFVSDGTNWRNCGTGAILA